MKYPFRQVLSAIILTLLLGVAIVSAAQTMIGVWHGWHLSAINQDASTLWEKRLVELRGDLPETGTFGYLSEMDIPDCAYNPIDTNEEYVLTQYYLAPRILLRGKAYDYVIGNFADLQVDSPAQLETLTGLSMIASYGNGIYLFKGELP